MLLSEDYSLFGETPTVKIYIPYAVSSYAFLKFFKDDIDADDEWIIFYKNKKLKDLTNHALRDKSIVDWYYTCKSTTVIEDKWMAKKHLAFYSSTYSLKFLAKWTPFKTFEKML